ncbi:DUF6298 domain-containing protein [Brevundimonas sp. NPDC003935]|uniref:DUF6298 domain-containing protein n=1 Tax=unclassified Brevundimonas TaxID=2622653 RepID=UPI0028AB8EAE|nr:DUF6298 domain-containing protein [Brevundimonas sp.]
MVRFWIAGLIVAASLAGASLAQTQPDFVALTPPIDFSHAGYRGGGVAAPLLPVLIRVEPGEGDDTDRILAALDRAAKAKPDAEGRRGAVLLAAGEYQVQGQIRLEVGGVVLRGAGPQATTIVATGVDRRALITVGARSGTADASTGVKHQVMGETPVGTVRLTLETTESLGVGDAVTIRRPSTAEWIAALGMDAFVGWRPETRLNWKPGSRDVIWQRRVVAVEGRSVVLDAPLTMALAAGDGATVRRGPSASRLREVGVENLTLVSRHDPSRPADEDHSWTGIAVDRAEDVWLRNLVFEGFVSSAIDLGPDSRRVAAQDVSASRPVSEIGGLRRRTFYTAGQQTLFQRCASNDGIHDFSVGHAAAGPNVFLDCTATDALGDSGTQESWATGVLFDGVKVRGGGLALTHRGRDGQGVGWSAANSVLWNCEATVVEVRSPPGAANVAVGCRGERSGDGVLEDARVMPGRDFHRAQPQEPASLYRMQLERRMGAGALAALDPATYPAEVGAPHLTEAEVAAWRTVTTQPVASHPLTIADGRFVIDGQPAWRRRIGFAFFQAQMVPALAEASGPFITRFAPGLEGWGLTDDLDAFAAGLKTGDVVHHNYGLWYDRRRVDHDFYGSPDQRDGEVWGPFMELPWARSGQGRAWDGLSKFDLERFNPWFFDRVARFADLAEQQGVVLYHKLYLQHWLLESRSHYVDFPWRPVNALQATGMPNEVPAAEVFWDVSDPVRRDLHRRYIRHTLETLKGRPNVVIGLDPEYTGPLSFVRFWLDEIAAWEAETGADARVALEIPKDQMDAILDDPARSQMVDAVAFHHWVYRPDTSLFAVQGGLDKAPREQVDAIARPQDLADGADAGEVRRALWRSTPAMRYRAYREYRDRSADLVVLNDDDAFPGLSRAVEATVGAEARASLRLDAALMAPTGAAWASSAPDGRVLIYSLDGAAIQLARSVAAGQALRWIADGAVVDAVASEGPSSLAPPAALAGRPLALWIAPAP